MQQEHTPRYVQCVTRSSIRWKVAEYTGKCKQAVHFCRNLTCGTQSELNEQGRNSRQQKGVCTKALVACMLASELHSNIGTLLTTAHPYIVAEFGLVLVEAFGNRDRIGKASHGVPSLHTMILLRNTHLQGVVATCCRVSHSDLELAAYSPDNPCILAGNDDNFC